MSRLVGKAKSNSSPGFLFWVGFCYMFFGFFFFGPFGEYVFFGLLEQILVHHRCLPGVSAWGAWGVVDGGF